MASVRSRATVLDAEFLEIRAALMQLASALDRIDRGEGSVEADPRVAQIRRALELLLSTEAGRAEKIQRSFSRPYEEDWRKQLKPSAR